MGFTIKTQEEAKQDSTSTYVRKTLNALNVHDVTLVKVTDVEEGTYGKIAKLNFVGLEEVEGLENPDTGNKQYVRMNMKFGEDKTQKSVDTFLKLAERIGKYDEFVKVLTGLQDSDDQDILDGIVAFFKEPFSILVSARLETDAESGKDRTNSYVNTNRPWCRTIKNRSELEKLVKEDPAQFTWDQRVVAAPVTEGGTDSEGEW